MPLEKVKVEVDKLVKQFDVATETIIDEKADQLDPIWNDLKQEVLQLVTVGFGWIYDRITLAI